MRNFVLLGEFLQEPLLVKVRLTLGVILVAATLDRTLRCHGGLLLPEKICTEIPVA